VPCSDGAAGRKPPLDVSSHPASPDRLTPAGSGRPFFDPTADVTDHGKRTVPDLERAIGALRDFTRRDILLRFYADHRTRGVDEVAREAGIHRSVAFEHLERLVALGYLEVARRRGLPGKPAKLYRLTAGPVQISHPMRRYDVLAEALARSFAELQDGEEKIREAGRTLGRGLAVPGARSTSAALEPLIELGGQYEIERDGRIACTNCLFAEVCSRARNVCLFHAGTIEGLLGADGADVDSLGPRGPGACAYHLFRR